MKNVEKIVVVGAPQKKSWFARNCPTFAAGGAAVGALVASTASNAFLTAADVTTATTAAGGEEVLSSTGVWVLTLVVGMVIVGLVISLIKKK